MYFVFVIRAFDVFSTVSGIKIPCLDSAIFTFSLSYEKCCNTLWKVKGVLQRQLVKCGINYLFHNFLCGCSNLDFNSWQLFIFFLILGNNDSFILLCINYFFSRV